MNYVSSISTRFAVKYNRFRMPPKLICCCRCDSWKLPLFFLSFFFRSQRRQHSHGQLELTSILFILFVFGNSFHFVHVFHALHPIFALQYSRKNLTMHNWRRIRRHRFALLYYLFLGACFAWARSMLHTLLFLASLGLSFRWPNKNQRMELNVSTRVWHSIFALLRLHWLSSIAFSLVVFFFFSRVEHNKRMRKAK